MNITKEFLITLLTENPTTELQEGRNQGFIYLLKVLNGDKEPEDANGVTNSEVQRLHDAFVRNGFEILYNCLKPSQINELIEFKTGDSRNKLMFVKTLKDFARATNVPFGLKEGKDIADAYF